MGGFNLSRGYILEIQSFCHGRNRMMRSVYCKRQNWWIEGGPVGFAGSTESLYCAHSGWWEGASVHKPQWAGVHRAGGGYTMLQKQLCITPDPVNLSHFC